MELIQTNQRHTLFRNPMMQAVVKIEASLSEGFRDYMNKNGFIEIRVPEISKATGSCENFNTLFEIASGFFKEAAYLGQTGQLYLEGYIPYFKKVWCDFHSFRAEPKVDGRHLCTFNLLELEGTFHFDDLLKHIQSAIKNMIRKAVYNYPEEISIFNSSERLFKILEEKFERVRYEEAINILKLNFGDDLSSKDEHRLINYFGNKPLFVTHYPLPIKFFNMIQDEKDPRVVKSADLLLPFGGEAVGSAEREYRPEILISRLKTSEMLKQLEMKGGSIEDFRWYLDHIKANENYPHSGCGIGLQRVTQFVLGVGDIRATTAFPLNRESLM